MSESSHMNDRTEDFEKLREKLAARLSKAIRRHQGKLKKLGQALAETAQEETLRQRGELLKAHLSDIRRGQKCVKVVDYYDDERREITIEIDPTKTAEENMKAFFKRARKMRSGKPRIEKEIASTQAQIEHLEKLSINLDNAEGPRLEEIAVEIRETLAPKKPKKPKGVPRAKLGPRRFTSSDGYEILVGRNQRQNDKLTLAIARGRDIFMHSGGSPGSHVIIRAKGQGEAIPPEQTMLEAANLAVYYSKLRNSKYAEVSWTFVKHVSKPRGAKPGLVYLAKHKTLGIEPDARLVKILHERERNS